MAENGGIGGGEAPAADIGALDNGAVDNGGAAPDNAQDNAQDNAGGNVPGGKEAKAAGGAEPEKGGAQAKAGKAGGADAKSGKAGLLAQLAEAGKEAGADGDGKAEGGGEGPITDWSAVDLGLPEGMETDPELMESLGAAVMECGLSESQARRLARWNLEAMAAQRRRQMEEGGKDLARAWGGRLQANAAEALGLAQRLDRALEARGREAGAFSKALASCGADNSAPIILGLYEAASWLSEDSLGKAEAGDMPERPETALEGLRDALEKARGGRV